MQHPFAGILDAAPPEVTPADAPSPTAAVAASRRSFLGRAFAAAAGLVGAGLLAGRSAVAQAQSPGPPRGTAEPLPLDGNTAHVQPVQYTIVQPRSQGSSITQWPRYQHGDPRPTTYALGEEGSYSPPRYRPPRGRYTTYALGEEGSTVTTYALGEEGSYRPWRPPYHGGHYRPSPVTTYALGEEGGGWRW
jgi:hypothetical protein